MAFMFRANDPFDWKGLFLVFFLPRDVFVGFLHRTHELSVGGMDALGKSLKRGVPTDFEILHHFVLHFLACYGALLKGSINLAELVEFCGHSVRF